MDIGSPDAKTIQSFFNVIPERYDFLNRILSFSFDQKWRRALVRAALEGWESSVLDIGTGTGTSLEAFIKVKKFDLAVGCDFSEGMLQVARRKMKEVLLVGADLHELPFRSESFDFVTSSFVLRSVQNMDQFFREVRRILTKRGKFLFLDLTRPQNPLFWNFFYKLYLTFCIPTVGRIVSRHPDAYQFLSKSIQTFVEPCALRDRMKEIGFSTVALKSLSFGAATIFIGRKES